MTQLSLKYKLAISGVLLLLVVQYGLLPLYDWRDAVIVHVQKLNRSVMRKKELLAHTDEIRKTWQSAETQIKAVEKYYQSGYADNQALQLGLQKKLEKICSETGAKVMNMDWLPVSEGDVTQAPLKVRMEVLPDKLDKILYDIENDPFFYSIDIIRITARPTSESLIVEMDISSYGIPKKKALSAVKKPSHVQ